MEEPPAARRAPAPPRPQLQPLTRPVGSCAGLAAAAQYRTDAGRERQIGPRAGHVRCGGGEGGAAADRPPRSTLDILFGVQR